MVPYSFFGIENKLELLSVKLRLRCEGAELEQMGINWELQIEPMPRGRGGGGG